MIAAKNFLKENKVLEKIEIKAQDLSKIKRLATEREMDYKRLVSEMLHDYATGLLKKAS
jgi:predicted DNA binding CopG/RHH family protein